jgi:hypothetical protein
VLFEVLENRRLMAAQVTMSGSTLTVQGDAGDDWVEVLEISPGIFTIQTDATSGPQSSPQWNAASGIFIDLGAGDSYFKLLVQTLPVIARTGDGPTGDQVIVENYNAEQAVAVSTGTGDDDISVHDFGAYGVAVMGGAGADTIKIVAASLNSVRPTLAFGGDGEDYLEGSGTYSLTEDDPETAEDEFSEIYDAGVGFSELYGDRDDDTFLTYNADTRIAGGSGVDVATIYLNALQKVKTSSIQDLEIIVVS